MIEPPPWVRPDGGCYIIAEAGVNHNGDMDLAGRLIDVAADAGADAVKFQTFTPEKLVAPSAPLAAYQVKGTQALDQLAMLRGLTLPPEQFQHLAAHAARRGITFLSTPFDAPSIAVLHRLGMPLFKIPSGEVTNHLHLRAVARLGVPCVLSTGMADLVEVARAVEQLQTHGAGPLMILHCTSQYPAPPESVNLRAMETLKTAFGLPVGYSDHTAGLPIALAAVARGAALLEKHITLDRTLPGPDHAASLEPAELTALVAAIRDIHQAIGNGRKQPHPAERDTRHVARRGLVAAQDLPEGHVLREADLDALRPAEGIPADQLDLILGRPLRGAVVAGQRLHWGLLG